jgi:hypothetical protein
LTVRSYKKSGAASSLLVARTATFAEGLFLPVLMVPAPSDA